MYLPRVKGLTIYPQIKLSDGSERRAAWRDGRVWFNALVLKTSGGAEPSLGSNPNPVAMKPVGFGGFLEGFSNNKKDVAATAIVWQYDGREFRIVQLHRPQCNSGMPSPMPPIGVPL